MSIINTNHVPGGLSRFLFFVIVLSVCFFIYHEWYIPPTPNPTAIDSRREGEGAKAYAVTDEWGTTADGILAGRGITPSVVAERSWGFRTTGTWEGVLVPESWSKVSQKFVPDFEKAVFSPSLATEEHPSSLCNVQYENKVEPGTWRLNMRHHVSGQCNYYIYAPKTEKGKK